jgi:hypothetical protein
MPFEVGPFELFTIAMEMRRAPGFGGIVDLPDRSVSFMILTNGQ